VSIKLKYGIFLKIILSIFISIHVSAKEDSETSTQINVVVSTEGDDKKAEDLENEEYSILRRESIIDGFVQVHKEKVDVSPILLAQQKGSIPIASIPWEQKVLVEMEDDELLQVIPYNFSGEKNFLIFTHTLRNENDEGFVRIYEYIHSNKKPVLVFQAKERSSFTFPSMYSNYIVEEGKVYFYYHGSDEGKKIRREYTLGSHNEPSYVKGTNTWNLEDPFYNHAGTQSIRTKNTSLIKTHVRRNEEEILFTLESPETSWLIGDISWHENDKTFYFDNHSAAIACIWRYDLATRQLEKIVPEHDAKSPYAYMYKGQEYIAYIENKQVKLARPHIEQSKPKAIEKKSQKFSEGFVQVHTTKQKLYPLLFNDSVELNVEEIVPWAQKDIKDIEEGKLIKVIAYEQTDELYLLYFVYFKNEKDEDSYMEFYEWKYGDKDARLLESYSNLSYEYYTNLHSFDNYMIRDGVFYFYVIGNDEVSPYLYDLSSHTRPEVGNGLDIPDDSVYDMYINHAKDTYAKVAYTSKGYELSLVDQKTQVPTVLLPLEELAWKIGDIVWSGDDSTLYFDNHGSMAACIWKYDLPTKSLQKIVPEHEAQHPFTFTYKQKNYVIYIENNKIKAATDLSERSLPST